MSFQTDIEAITGSLSGLTTEATQALKDGTKQVIKLLMKNNAMKSRLTQDTTLNNSPTTMDTTNTVLIESVTRNDGTRSRKASVIDEANADDYQDVNSIYYTSKLDPVYYISNDTLHVIPTPASGQSALVKHITPATNQTLSASAIDNLPSELNRGVVLFAAIEILRKQLNNKNTTLINLSTNLNNIDPPDGSSVISDVTYSGPGNDDVGSASSGSGVSNSTGVQAGNDIDLGSPPAYNKSSSGLDHDAGSIAVNDFIDTEDVELAQIALSKESQKLQNYQAEIADELNEFNGQANNYRIEIQTKLDRAQRNIQASINDARNDLAAAQATAQLATNVSIRNQAEKSQRLIQNAINAMQAIMADNQANLSKYTLDLNRYQARVSEAVQEYQLAFQEVVQDYNWLAQQYQIARNDFIDFLSPYIMLGGSGEVATDDRSS